MGRLLTSEELQKRNIVSFVSVCSRCGLGYDSFEHIFMACSVAALVWVGLQGYAKRCFR
ncbi:putative reverse transcriptase zinc-binding domain-containing protein [Helianthus anomalus]